MDYHLHVKLAINPSPADQEVESSLVGAAFDRLSGYMGDASPASGVLALDERHSCAWEISLCRDDEGVVTTLISPSPTTNLIA